MNHTFQRLLVVATVLGLNCAEAHADLLDDAKLVRPVLAAKYEAAYAHVEINTVERFVRAPGDPTWIETCEYLSNGNLLRKTAKTTQPDRPGIKVGRVGVVAVSSDYGFQANQADTNAQFTLQDFKAIDKAGSSVTEKTSSRPLFAHGFIDAIKIDDLLSGKVPYARPTSATEATLDGKRVIKVALDVKAESEPQAEWLLYFLPNTWAFAGATQHMPGGVGFEYRISYLDDDPFRLKSFRRWIVRDRERGAKFDFNEIDVTSINFRTVPEAEFRMTVFGIEEPAIARSRGLRSPLLWINGLIFAGLGIWLAVLAHRRRKRGGESTGRQNIAPQR
ncbi:MAG: hypothetical protein WBD22_02350 [Pyrinomonadaceae bacterium]